MHNPSADAPSGVPRKNEDVRYRKRRKYEDETGGDRPYERPLANYIIESHDTTYSDMLANVYVLHPSAEFPVWANPMFRAQLFEFLFSLAMLVVSSLVIGANVSINSYAFLFALCISWSVLTIIHIFAIMYWEQQAEFSHPHNNAIFFAFYLWLIVSIVEAVLLGVWLLNKNDSTCCGFEDSQPTKIPPFSNEYTRFLIVYAFMCLGNSVSLAATAGALIAHYYPGARLVVPTVLASSFRKTE